MKCRIFAKTHTTSEPFVTLCTTAVAEADRPVVLLPSFLTENQRFRQDSTEVD